MSETNRLTPCWVRQLRRLKKLDYVTRRVCAENLFAPRPLQDIVSESYAFVGELRDEGVQIVDSQDEPGPTSRAGLGAI